MGCAAGVGRDGASPHARPTGRYGPGACEDGSKESELKEAKQGQDDTQEHQEQEEHWEWETSPDKWIAFDASISSKLNVADELGVPKLLYSQGDSFEVDFAARWQTNLNKGLRQRIRRRDAAASNVIREQQDDRSTEVSTWPLAGCTQGEWQVQKAGGAWSSFPTDICQLLFAARLLAKDEVVYTHQGDCYKADLDGWVLTNISTGVCHLIRWKPSEQHSVQFQWQTKSGAWLNYLDEDNSLLAAARAAGHSMVSYSARGHDYEVDFGKMLETCSLKDHRSYERRTGFVRKVRIADKAAQATEHMRKGKVAMQGYPGQSKSMETQSKQEARNIGASGYPQPHKVQRADTSEDEREQQAPKFARGVGKPAGPQLASSGSRDAEVRRKSQPPAPFQNAFGTTWKSVSTGSRGPPSRPGVRASKGSSSAPSGKQPPPPPMPHAETNTTPATTAAPGKSDTKPAAAKSYPKAGWTQVPADKTRPTAAAAGVPPSKPSRVQTLRLPKGLTMPEAPSAVLVVEGLLSELLSVPLDERRKAFKTACFQWHPDKNPSNEELATEVFQFLQRLRGWYLGT
eukprot:TRINITY_DN105603_c0_g1_i1.p1 TRINITY_DN105603_c0_g1~~TRINITY_DN105603_c0_g1_i1.p1  ORF type:complete len:571 (+),score=117.47 TRINITY_DN105603_c0_g1_i1:88-1800(+)